MSGKSITRTIFLALCTFALASCVKYPPYEFPENAIEERNDSITLSLISILKADSIEKTVKWIEGMGTRFTLADNRRTIALSIKNKFEKMGYDDSRLDSFWISKTWNSQVYEMWQYNVITELHGSRYSDSLMIIGAHYDAIVASQDPFISTPGANDNASGIAVMMEIARVMKYKNYRPLSTIHFVAFGAEEIGLMGSSDYAQSIGPSGKEVKLMINNDMVGYVADPNPLTWKLTFVSYDNSLALLNKAGSMCNRYTDIGHINDNTYYNRSDSYSFYTKGYRSIFFISNDPYEYYHSLNDTYLKCNFDFCTEVARLSSSLLVWSDTPEL